MPYVPEKKIGTSSLSIFKSMRILISPIMFYNLYPIATPGRSFFLRIRKFTFLWVYSLTSGTRDLPARRRRMYQHPLA